MKFCASNTTGLLVGVPWNSKSGKIPLKILNCCLVGLFVLGQSLSLGKPLLTLHPLHLTVSSSLVLQGLGPSYESFATSIALVRPLIYSAASDATSSG